MRSSWVLKQKRESATPSIRPTTKRDGTSHPTAGVFGAAAAIGKLLGLSVATDDMGAGHGGNTGFRTPRDVRLHGEVLSMPGHAAKTGIPSAIMAKSDFTAGPNTVSKGRGGSPQSGRQSTICRKLRTAWGQTFKSDTTLTSPIRAGWWCIPRSMAASILSRSSSGDPAASSPSASALAPLVMDLCNKKDITRGLEGKYSIYHSCGGGPGPRQGRPQGIYRCRR